MCKIVAYTDGSCSGNPGPGGWSAILSTMVSHKNEDGTVTEFEHQKEFSGREDNTTNNRMELRACVEALKAVHVKEYEMTLYSDSRYVVDHFCCVPSWKARGWKSATGTKVKNVDLWEELNKIVDENKVNITFKYVPGHSGSEQNERCDKLARAQTALAVANAEGEAE